MMGQSDWCSLEVSNVKNVQDVIPSYLSYHGVQRRMISVDNFFVFLRLSFFALLLLYVA